MTWPDLEWDAFVNLLNNGWPGELDAAAARSWRTLLDGLEPGVAGEALQRLLLEGHRFRPSVSELIEAARRDPSKPTFAEAYQLIFGRRGALRATPTGPAAYASAGTMRKATNDAARARAAGMHPLIVTFIDRQGIDRLRQLPINDPDWGEKHRRDLERAWDQHTTAMADRDVAALAAGGERRGQIARFDPMTALAPAGAPQLPEETETR